VGKSGIYMEGRELQIDRAVDKGTAQTQFTATSKKETEERDKRNLYLATEGCKSASLLSHHNNHALQQFSTVRLF
jgi:hypothetical protein